MDNFLFGLASFALVLIPLIIIHEFGHFIAAKLTGITVLEFGIGFPPRVKTMFTKGDTIYTINALPIGGFVRPYGEDFVKPKTERELYTDRQEIEERGITNPKSIFQANPWQRIFFMAAGPGINFLTALLLFIVVALVGKPFLRADVTIYDVQADSTAAQAGLQTDDIIVEFNGKDVTSANTLNRWIDQHSNQIVTLLINRNGDLFETQFDITPTTSPIIEQAYILTVKSDSPAHVAGLLPGDFIIAIDGEEIVNSDQIITSTQSHENKAMIITVLRETERIDISVTPQKDEENVVRMGFSFGTIERAQIGIFPINRNESTYTRALPLSQAISSGVEDFVWLNKMIYQFVGDLFAGKVELSSARPVSPVGIGQIGAPIFKQSLDENEMHPIISFAAMLSITLAISNLLPIPGLDGGRILFVIIELLRGKPMKPEREGVIHLIGVMLLLCLIFIAFINDIIHPINLEGLK